MGQGLRAHVRLPRAAVRATCGASSAHSVMRTGRHVARVATRCARARRDGVLVRPGVGFLLVARGPAGIHVSEGKQPACGSGSSVCFRGAGDAKDSLGAQCSTNVHFWLGGCVRVGVYCYCFEFD